MISRIALVVAMAAATPAFAQNQIPTPDAGSTPAQQAGTPAPAKSVADVQAKASAPVAQPVADSDNTGEVVVTGHFIDTGAKSAMKMNVPVLDTPFSVASYSNSFVKALDTTSVSDLYNYMTGVKKSGNTGYDVTMRGFKNSGDDRNSIMVDGLPGLTGRYGSPPTVNIDHVELVKGPMSVLYGQIQPGGFVNLVTKKPQARQEISAEVRLNTYMSDARSAFSHNGVTGEIDATGPITKDDSLLYRVTGELLNVEGFRDQGRNKEKMVAPSLTWKPGSDTTITVQGEYRHVNQHMDNGLVAPSNGTIYDPSLADVITASYQQPDDYRVETGKALSAFLTQGLGGKWTLNASYRHVTYSSDQKSFDQTGFVTVKGVTEVQRRARALSTRRHYDYGDINISGAFDTGFIEHKILVGVNGGADMVEENRTKFFNSSVRNATTGVCPTGGTCLEIPVYDPSAFYGNYPGFDSLPAINPQLSNQQSLLTDKFTHDHNYGVYVSDLMTLTPWLKVSIADRKYSETARVQGDRRNAPNDIRTRTDSKSWLPSAGILIEPTRHITIYGSYAESFVPADPSAIDPNGVAGTLHPITAKQIEGGVKLENMLDNRLSLTASVYQIDQDGQVTQNPCAFGTCSYQTGKGRSTGFEVETNFTPIRNMQVLAGYSHIDAKVRTSPILPFQIGDQLPNVAKDALNFWSRYDWENGFGMGLGVTYTGPRQGLLPTSANDLKLLPLPGYMVVDSGFYWTQKHYIVNLKIGNLFDKRYWESAGATGRIQLAPGQPRYATLSVRVKF